MKPDIAASDMGPFAFLASAGEMGRLTLEKQWELTPLGPLGQWPQSLRTSLSIMMNCRFPMFLVWGPEMICFYNDAYRPSLGNTGKHPQILGQPASVAWQESWDFIRPILENVLISGEPVYQEDQLIPMYRNGRTEDVYWTFSNSPVYDELGKPAGVFVTGMETTHKVVSLQEAIQREDQLAFTLDAAELGTWDLNPITNRFVGNERLKEWFGLERDDEIPLTAAIDVIPEKDRQRVMDAIEFAMNPASGGEYNIEYAIDNPKTKQRRVVVGKGRALFDELQKPYRFSGTLQDITDRVNAEQQIAVAEQRTRLALDATRLGTFDLDIPANHIVYSERCAEIFDFGSLHPHHDDLIKRILPQDLYIRNNAHARAMITGELEYECRLRWRDQSIHWIHTTGKVYYDENNKPQRLLGTVNDTTAAREAVEGLRLTTERFRILADSMPQLVWTGGPDGHLNYFNQSVMQYSGVPLETIISEGWLQIVHPDDRPGNIEQWNHSISTGEPFLFEHRFRRHDGEYRWQLSRALPQRNAEGAIEMWVGTSTDIHDQKNLTQELEAMVQRRTSELQESNNALVKSNAELAQFAYVASHDLQEPLRKIQTFISRLSDTDGGTSARSADYFQRIQNAAGRMQQLIVDLLSFSRVNTSDQLFEITDLNELLCTVKENLQDALELKKGTLTLGDLPTLSIIPFQFEQLFTNLVSNAIKFSREDLPPVIAVTSSRVAKGSAETAHLGIGRNIWRISVKDNGIGFEQEYNEKIFNVFQRLHPRESYEGTGIGLAIVKKIVENHKGLITAHSVPSEGAEFLIYLPG